MAEEDEGEQLKNGPGEEDYPDGSKYVGDFVEGKRHGEGTFTWPDGKCSYKGEFADGRREGKGTFYWGDGAGYEGNWEQGRQKGEGICFWEMLNVGEDGTETRERQWEAPIIVKDLPKVAGGDDRRELETLEQNDETT